MLSIITLISVVLLMAFAMSLSLGVAGAAAKADACQAEKCIPKET